MENLEKQIVRIIENNSPELAAEEILRLLGIVGRSEQLPQIHGLTRCECGEVYDVDLKVNCPKCGN